MWFRSRILIGLSSKYDLVKGLIRDSDPCGFHICNYGNGCIKFSKVQAQRDDLIIQGAAISIEDPGYSNLIVIVKFSHLEWLRLAPVTD